MSGTLPQSPAFSSLTVTSVQPSFVSRSISGRRQARQTHGQFFKLTAKYPAMTRAQFSPINAFIMSQRGQYESFQVIPPVINAGHTATQSSDAGWEINEDTQPVTQASTSGSGTGATFLTRTNTTTPPNNLWSVTVTGVGSGYAVSDTIELIDPKNTANLATLTVSSIDGSGGITGLSDSSPETRYNGPPKVNGASQTGRSVITEGWNQSTVAFKAGDYCKFANHDKVYTVCSDATADANGNVTLTIEPALVTSPANDSSITYTAVPFTVALTGRVQEFETNTTGLFEYELDLEEVL